MDEVAHAEVEAHRPDQGAPDHARGEPTARPHTRPQAQVQTQTQTQTTPSSPYPFDCLVLVRNVHPGTNKTTLKSLFAQAFQDQDGSGTSTPSRPPVSITLTLTRYGYGACSILLFAD